MTDTERLFAAFAGQVIVDAWLEATSAYWLHRAEQFNAARPRPGDFLGTGTTTEERAERDRRMALRAEACRARALFTDAAARECYATLHALAQGDAA